VPAREEAHASRIRASRDRLESAVLESQWNTRLAGFIPMDGDRRRPPYESSSVKEANIGHVAHQAPY
jgi:hypothetical protein